MISEEEAIKRIKQGLIRLPPLTLRLCDGEQRPAGRKAVDAVLDVIWQSQSYRFGAEYRSRSTPKEFQSALDETLRANKATGLHPMVLMPFLNEKQLLELADRQISGLDFSGNGVIVIPSQLFVLRTGAANQFPASEVIQNVYRKNSSIVPRAFLACPVFDSVNGVAAFIQTRSGYDVPVSLSTISKVLKVLEEDLIISRGKNAIRLLQPEKLLETLVSNFTRPVIKRFLVGKSPYDTEVLMGLLSSNSQKHQLSLVGTGTGSVARYAVMAREDLLSVYCTDQHRLMMGIEFKETPRFSNLEVIETQDKTVYFDARKGKGFEWASPVQTYLELMAGDQREKDTATQVRAVILEGIKGDAG